MVAAAEPKNQTSCPSRRLFQLQVALFFALRLFGAFTLAFGFLFGLFLGVFFFHFLFFGHGRLLSGFLCLAGV